MRSTSLHTLPAERRRRYFRVALLWTLGCVILTLPLIHRLSLLIILPGVFYLGYYERKTRGWRAEWPGLLSLLSWIALMVVIVFFAPHWMVGSSGAFSPQFAILTWAMLMGTLILNIRREMREIHAE